MKQILVSLLASLILGATVFAEDKPPAKELLSHYQGKLALPEDLYAAYAEFVKALETYDEAAIQKHCLPQSVSITRQARPEKEREYGPDINLPFLKRGFSKYIMIVQKDPEDTYLVRTASTNMHFVRTASGNWKLYQYGDKPIM